MTGFVLFVAIVAPLSVLHFGTRPAIASPAMPSTPSASASIPDAPMPPQAPIAPEAPPAPEPPPQPRLAAMIASPPLPEAPPVPEVPPVPATPPLPPAPPHPPEPPHPGRGWNGHDGGLSTSSKSGATTCADFSYRFSGDMESARGEQTINFSGSRLAVTAAENGGVTLRRSTTGNFSISACKAAGGTSQSEASRLLSRIAVVERNGSVTVQGPEDGPWTVNLIVSVPDGRSIDVRAENGPVAVRDLNATLNVRVVNGPLSLSNSRGDIKVQTVNGPLALTGMSGNVQASVDNGPLAVKLDGREWAGGQLRAKVVNGPLAVKVPRGYASGVKVNKLGHGPLACSLPECRSLTKQERGRPPSFEPREVTIGSGTARVFLEGGNGPVTISQKD